MKRAYRHKANGYTLIEVLLYVAITGTLLSALVAFFAMSTTSRLVDQAVVTVDYQGTFVGDTILRHIRNADTIVSPTPGQTTSQLTVSKDGGASEVTVSMSNAKIYLAETGVPVAALTNDDVEITGFSVKNLSHPNTAGSVQISLTVKHASPSDSSPDNYSKTFTVSGSIRR